MQNKSVTKLDFENDSNLRAIPSTTVMQKPDSYYLSEVNKVSCDDSNLLLQDNLNSNIYYCYNNGPAKNLVEWKKSGGSMDSPQINKHQSIQRS